MASGKSSNSGNPSNPKDAQVMAAILKDMGIIEYEPRVINQMLEFTYKYVTTMLDDARLFSSHAKKKNIDVDDVRLAIQLQMDKSFTCPPPRDLLLEVARQKNSTPLPLIKSSAGARLPPDRYCLSACNYRLKPQKKPRMQINVPSSKVSFSSLQPGSSNTGPSISRVMPAIPLASKSGTVLSVVTKTVGSPTVTLVTRTVTTPTPTKGKMTPTPIFKLSQGPIISSSPLVSVKTSKPTTTSSSAVTSQNSSVSQSLADLPENEKKRKREDDPDDYDVE
ncbi:transcription initiation factor TFIID subunit 9-like [Limulus polyphemus]|uniref:Transcription initiation factor TFIID subunit 9-like n=1 Tax=Limulus polyphemus TaxID=6850 RepID=A0ABM1BY81_LIMPO|nr:transcription initiation factor TFIID subunit 9-like [Limulus polyphemus]